MSRGSSTTDPAGILYGNFDPSQRNQRAQKRLKIQTIRKRYEITSRRARAIRDKRTEGLGIQDFLKIVDGTKDGAELRKRYGLTPRKVESFFQRNFYSMQEPYERSDPNRSRCNSLSLSQVRAEGH